MSKPKVLLTGRIPGEVMARLAGVCDVEANTEDRPMDREKLIELIRDREGLISMITDGVDGKMMAAAPRLKMIANMAVGFNNIDLKAATARGIPVSNTPGVLTDATAELAFALLLAAARRIPEMDRKTRAGEFRWWAPMLFLGREVSGKTLGIIGLGRIGKAVARRARGFDMRVLYCNPARLDPAEERALRVEYADLRSLLREADFVSLHVPLTEATKHLIGAEELALMKPTSYLINTSRGPVVDEKALVQALRGRKIEGAGLDVYENEPALAPGLAELENVTLLPHVGSGTLETRVRMASLAVENLLAGLNGESPPNILNPEVLQAVYKNG
ncbi:MAG: D-glycerate dehydrogenase [Syntrophales bacterium]|nr:D-glycerate dehydrogenase [Syntrophales bacterium]